MAMQPLRVLVIDDDPTLLDMYRARLLAEGFMVETAPDGEQGLARVTEVHPNVILVDMRMPRITGLEVLEILKTTKATKDIPVIVLSALGDDTLKKQALDRGAAAYLTKADTMPATIVQKIRELLSPSSGEPAQPSAPKSA